MKNQIILPNAELIYFPDFLKENESDHYFDLLLKDTEWKTKVVNIKNKSITQNRLVAWYSELDVHSTFFSYTDYSKPWTNKLLEIKKKVEICDNNLFNGVLLNLYRNGNDRIGWHSDDTEELGVNPTIASLSLGASRVFKLRHKTLKINLDIVLPHGSLLIMKSEIQHFWEHCIPTEEGISKARINLTFRNIQILNQNKI